MLDREQKREFRESLMITCLGNQPKLLYNLLRILWQKDAETHSPGQQGPGRSRLGQSQQLLSHLSLTQQMKWHVLVRLGVRGVHVTSAALRNFLNLVQMDINPPLLSLGFIFIETFYLEYSVILYLKLHYPPAPRSCFCLKNSFSNSFLNGKQATLYLEAKSSYLRSEVFHCILSRSLVFSSAGPSRCFGHTESTCGRTW